MLRRRMHFTAICLELLIVPAAYASCGSSACSINTNWDEHSINQPGVSVDLRYSYAKLTSFVPVAAKSRPQTLLILLLPAKKWKICTPS